MASIDNRVVNLEFDNASFGKNVDSTLQSLTQLHEGINKSVGDIDLGGIESGVSNISDKFSALGAIGFTAIQNLTNSAIGFGQKIAGSVLDPLVEGGKRRALNIEQAKFQFEGLGLDVEKTMASARDAVKGTAYGLDEAAKIAGIFGTTGMQAGEEMTTALRAIAGTAAMSGAGFMEVGDIFTDVFGKGKAQAEDFNRLSARGVGGAQMIAKYLEEVEGQAGITGAEVTKMASEGKISSEMFATAMNWAFGEHAAKANDIYTGSLSNMRAALSRIGAEFQSVKLERHRKTFNALTPVIDELHESMMPVVELYAKWQTYKGDMMVKAITGMQQPIKDLKPSFENVASTITNLSNAARAIGKPFVDAFKSVFNLDGASQGFVGTINNITKAISDFTAKLVLSEESQAKLKNFFEGILGVAKQFGSFLVAVGSGIAAFTKGLFGAFSGGESTGFTNMLNFIGDALKKATGGIEGFRESLGMAGEYLGGKFGEAISWVIDKLKIIGSWIKDNISIKDVFKGLIGIGTLKGIKSFIDLINKVSGFFDAGIMGMIFGTGGDSGGKAQEVFSFKNIISEFFSSLGDSLQAFTGAIKIGQLVLVAVAITMLASSIRTLTELDTAKLPAALTAMAGLFAMLSISLSSFSKTMSLFGGKGLITSMSSLILVSIAIKSLVGTMERLSSFSGGDIFKSLSAIGALFLEMGIFLRLVGSSKLALRSSIGLYVITRALRNIVDALEPLSKMSADELQRSLSALGIALLELAGITKLLSGVKVNLRTLAMVGVLVVSLQEIAKALTTFSEIDPDKLATGLTAMGWALLELSTVSMTLSKFGRISGITGAASIYILVQTLSDIAEALKMFSDLDPERTGDALFAMGIALGELAALDVVLGRVNALNGLAGAAGTYIIVQTLSDIAAALGEFAMMDWESIKRGLVGMGGALSELVFVILLASRAGKISSIVSAVSIFIVVESLQKIAEAMQMFGDIDWGTVGRGLVGLGGALGIIGTILAVMGKSGGKINLKTGALGGISQLLASGALLLIIQGLDDLATPLLRISSMSWDQVGRGLVGLGGALGILGTVIGVLGTLAPWQSVLGGFAIAKAVEPLDELAQALAKFGEMNWGEIGRGLSAMLGALSSLALGTFLNSLSYLGAASVAKAAKPLGDLADSVKKWSGVEVPEGLGGKMGELAKAVGKFTWAFVGSKSVNTVAKPLGDLADSIRKWVGLQVPTDLGTNLEMVAQGIKHFVLSDWLKGKGLASVVEPLSQMADAIRKWEGVTVPEGLEPSLKSLATGIGFFAASDWFKGLAIGNSVGPISDMAAAVRMWDGVSVPENIEPSLKHLAMGVGHFDPGKWFDALAIGNAVKPLRNMVDSVQAWSGVTVPENIEPSLKHLAQGVGHFGISEWFNAVSVNKAIAPLLGMADAVVKWNSITIPEKISEDMERLATAIGHFGGGEWFNAISVNKAIEPLTGLANAAKQWMGVTVSMDIDSQMNRMATGLKYFQGLAVSSVLAENLGIMAVSVQKWSGLLVPLTIEAQLRGISNGLKTFQELNLTDLSTKIGSVVDSLNGLNGFSVTMTDDLVGLQGVISNTATSFDELVTSSGNAASEVKETFSGVAASVETEMAKAQSSVETHVSGIESRMPPMVEVVGTALVNLAQKVANEIPAAASNGSILLMFALTTMAAQVSGMSGTMRSAGYSVGWAIAEGMSSGIYSGSSIVNSAAATVASRALSTAKASLGIHSPSRAFFEIGKYSAQGQAQGMLQNIGVVSQAGTTMGDAAVNSVISAVESISTFINDNIDTTPVIRPVVDISEAEKRMQALDALMASANGQAYNEAYSRAMTAQQSFNTSRASADVDKTENKQTVINYKQVNNSPKALSNGEIYRQTKNQLSQLRSRVDA